MTQPGIMDWHPDDVDAIMANTTVDISKLRIFFVRNKPFFISYRISYFWIKAFFIV